MRELLLIHAAATVYMAGLIWFVQIVHYPLMARVGREGFAAYESAHTSRTTWVVAPAMLVESTLALLLAIRPPEGVAAATAWIAFALVGIIWLSTALLQVPMHRRLARGFDQATHRRLVSSNWIRTIAWSARGVLVFGWLG